MQKLSVLMACVANIGTGIFSQADQESNQIDLMYFGKFREMKIDDYLSEMIVVVKNRGFSIRH